jgi:hypothetical protein
MSHISDEQIARYTERMTTEEETSSVEQHVLTCAACVARLEREERFLQVLQAAHSQLGRAGAEAG